MTLWKSEGEYHQVVFIPLCVQGINTELTLSFVAESEMKNAFLYTDSAYIGLFAARITGTTTYYEIGEYSLTPSCFLGDIAEDEEVSVDFRLYVPTDSVFIGEEIIPISVGYGDNVSRFYLENDIFWENSLISDDFFWYESSDEVDLYQWRGSV